MFHGAHISLKSEFHVLAAIPEHTTSRVCTLRSSNGCRMQNIFRLQKQPDITYSCVKQSNNNFHCISAGHLPYVFVLALSVNYIKTIMKNQHTFTFELFLFFSCRGRATCFCLTQGPRKPNLINNTTVRLIKNNPQ